MDQQALAELTAALRGTALTPSHAAYDESRRIWNGTVDRRPAVIARCRGARDVIEAVSFARDNGLGVSIRAGGHHVAGSSLLDGGLVVDLSAMRSVHVDAPAATVRAEGGALIGDLDRETQVFQLAVPLGLVSETGIGGLTLAGGLGWLRRKHGLSCDNLISADVVTADGRLLHASHDENGALFWALRGGGWDLGVVTSFEYRAHPLGPDVWVTFVGYPWEQAVPAMQRYREYMATAPDGVGAVGVYWTVPEVDIFPKERWRQPLFLVVGPYAGPVAEGQKATRPLHELATPMADASGALPYVTAQTAVFDEDYPSGRRYYWKSVYLRELSDAAIDVLRAMAAKKPSPLTSLDVWALGGAIARVGAADTPVGHREAPYLIGIESNWDEPADDGINIAWAREVAEALKPFSTGGSYLNFEDLSDAGAAARSHGANFERLVSIKKKYDPDNLFRSRRGLVD